MEHSRTRIIIDGAVAGIIGAVVVAVWFLIFDVIRGHALETPALLAATILHGSHSHEVHHALALLALAIGNPPSLKLAATKGYGGPDGGIGQCPTTFAAGHRRFIWTPCIRSC